MQFNCTRTERRAKRSRRKRGEGGREEGERKKHDRMDEKQVHGESNGTAHKVMRFASGEVARTSRHESRERVGREKRRAWQQGRRQEKKRNKEREKE